MMIEGIVTWAEIDLDAVEHNVRAFKRHVGEQVEVIAVVKANAYGHGAVPVGKAALAAGATRLAVHRAIEGVELRQAGLPVSLTENLVERLHYYSVHEKPFLLSWLEFTMAARRERKRIMPRVGCQPITSSSSG
mgnify:CR=1 FL=1